MKPPPSIFQEPPPDLDETWNHGAALGSSFSCDDEMLARSYFAAGAVLIRHVLSNRVGDSGQDFVGPILFTYRHGIELYLKAIVKPEKRDHNLGSLLEAYCRHVRGRYNESLPKWVTRTIDEFIQVDRGSDLFRYGDPDAPVLDITHWVDFRVLRRTMIFLEWVFRRTMVADVHGLRDINAMAPRPQLTDFEDEDE
jgi:hypothetical protein